MLDPDIAWHLPPQALTDYISSTGKTQAQFLADKTALTTLLGYHVSATVFGSIPQLSAADSITTIQSKILTVSLG